MVVSNYLGFTDQLLDLPAFKRSLRKVASAWAAVLTGVTRAGALTARAGMLQLHRVQRLVLCCCPVLDGAIRELRFIRDFRAPALVSAIPHPPFT